MMIFHNMLVPLLVISVVSTAQVQDKSYNIGLLTGPVLTNQKYPPGVDAVYADAKSTSEISSWNYSVQAYKVTALPKNWQLEINLSFDAYAATTEFNYDDSPRPGMTTAVGRDVRYIASGSKLSRRVGQNKWTLSPFAGFAIEYLLFSQDKTIYVNSSGALSQSYTDVTGSEKRINFNYDVGVTVGYDLTSKVMLTLRPYYKHNLQERVSDKLFYGYGVLLGARLM
jgi:hypothetical protein